MYSAWDVQHTIVKITAALAGLLALLLAQAPLAGAQETERQVEVPGKVGALEERVQQLETRSMSETLDLKLYGYVDLSYVSNFNNPASGVNNLRGFDVDSDAFRVEMAQIVLEKLGKIGGAHLSDNAGFRIKLDFGEDSQFTGGDDFSDEVDFQEVYAQFVAPVGTGLDLRMGRQNTLIGYEVIESPYNLNYSRSWMFSFGQPFTTTGIRGAYDVTDKLSVALGGISSFTQGAGDTNSAISIESAVSYQVHERVGITGYLFWGDEKQRKATGAGDVILGGGILNLQATDQTQFILEGYYANAANVDGSQQPSGNARWNGVAGYLVHDFTEQWGLRIRGEIWEDASGTRTCQGTLDAPKANVCFGATATTTADVVDTSGNTVAVVVPGQPGTQTPQTLWETTITLQFRPVKSLMTRLEFRYDKSDKPTFTYGTRAANHQETLSAEVIYLF